LQSEQNDSSKEECDAGDSIGRRSGREKENSGEASSRKTSGAGGGSASSASGSSLSGGGGGNGNGGSDNNEDEDPDDDEEEEVDVDEETSEDENEEDSDGLDEVGVGAGHDEAGAQPDGADAQHDGADAHHDGADARHGGADAQHDGADAQHDGADAQHGGAVAQHGGAVAQHGGADPQHGGADPQHRGVDAQLDGGLAAGLQQAGAQEPGNWLSYESLMNETFPSKSKGVYLAAYREFEIYLKSCNKFEPNVVPTETMLLNYFHHLKNVKFWKATTIWSTYSRLNGVLKRRFKISLKNLPSITDLLKSFEVGHRVKKSNVFTPQQELLFILYVLSFIISLR
jgi:hypothetical protein